VSLADVIGILVVIGMFGFWYYTEWRYNKHYKELMEWARQVEERAAERRKKGL
jgi:hypothetical protein